MKYAIGHPGTCRTIDQPETDPLHRHIRVRSQQHLTVRRSLSDSDIIQPNKGWGLVHLLNANRERSTHIGWTVGRRNPHHIRGGTMTLARSPREDPILTQCRPEGGRKQQVADRLDRKIGIDRPKLDAVGL